MAESLVELYKGDSLANIFEDSMLKVKSWGFQVNSNFPTLRRSGDWPL